MWGNVGIFLYLCHQNNFYKVSHAQLTKKKR